MRVFWTIVVIIVTASLVQAFCSAWSNPALTKHIEKIHILEAELEKKSAALDECTLTRQGMIDAIVEQK